MTRIEVLYSRAMGYIRAGKHWFEVLNWPEAAYCKKCAEDIIEHLINSMTSEEEVEVNRLIARDAARLIARDAAKNK